ncbi:MAG: ferritin-like domain-containing protein [Myxococcales bacterium]|nr:ferritin-like domain-containing protein [Myxococcales bacterium]
MDEKKFQRLLQEIVRKTLPATLVVGTLAFSPACSGVVILGTDGGGSEAVVESAPERVLSSKTPYEDSSCPESLRCSYPGTGGKEEKVHVYRKFVDTPLTFEECRSACYSYAEKICPSENGPNSSGDPYVQTYPSVVSCKVEPHKDGGQMLDCEYTVSWGCVIPGRRPDGLEEAAFQAKLVATHQENAVGGFFARAAHFEAAAAVAFEYLAKELELHEAPAELQKMAQEAILEETQHAELMGTLAVAHGGSLLPVEVEPFRSRSLFEIACENVVEGCYNETMSALSVLWQSIHAEDSEVREVFARIAFDETRHAALSWGLDAWLQGKLSVEEQEKLGQIKEEAFAKMKQDLLEEPPIKLRDVLGLPSAAQSLRMFEQLGQSSLV